MMLTVEEEKEDAILTVLRRSPNALRSSVHYSSMLDDRIVIDVGWSFSSSDWSTHL